MSDQPNGHDANAAGMGRVLSLQNGTPPKHALTRAQRAEVERIAYDLVIQECAKVHEYYLNQIPSFTARMIQDALMSYGLVELKPGTTDIAPAGGTSAATDPAPGVSASDNAAPIPPVGTPQLESAPDVAPE